MLLLLVSAVNFHAVGGFLPDGAHTRRAQGVSAFA
jgi:hypothetical protein